MTRTEPSMPILAAAEVRGPELGRHANACDPPPRAAVAGRFCGVASAVVPRGGFEPPTY